MKRTTLPVFFRGYNPPEHGQQTVEILLGDPSLKIDALLDIAWPDTIVPSILCKGDEFVYLATNLYDESKSSTAKTLDENIKHSRDSLYLKGVQLQETVTLGYIVVESQAVSSLYAVQKRGWGGGGYHAILGLVPNPSPSTDNPYDPRLEKPSVFQNMIDRGMLERNVFGFRPASKSENIGELHLGWIDSSYSERLVEISLGGLSTENPWHVSLPAILVGDQEIQLEGYYAFFTTATSFFDLPRVANEALELSLASDFVSETGQEIDCRKLTTGPPLTFLLGPERKPFVMGPSFYLDEILDEDGESHCFQKFFEPQEFSGMGETKHINIGTSFLEAFYSVFDADRKTISFAAIDA